MDSHYRPDNVPLFEALYGKNLISLGKTAAIDNMFLGVNLKGKRALDLGFGLGGVAFYLAEKYAIEIAGVEVHPWMAQYAKEHTPQDLAQQLKFEVYNSKGNIPFTKDSFDIVYSKGVLNHVKEKSSLFCQVHELLKVKGLFVIADWIYPESIEVTGPLVCETEESYRQVLENAGFTIVDFKDDSKIFLTFIKAFLENMSSQADWIIHQCGKDVYSSTLEQHYQLIGDIDNKRKKAIRIIASR